MKRLFAAALLLALCLSFCGCVAGQPEADTIRIASLKGPTSMGLVELYSRSDVTAATETEGGYSPVALDYTLQYQICGSADEITPLLVSGQLDMAAIPANLAATLYNKQDGALVVCAINTLGVLYVLETGQSINSIADLAGKTVYSTGKGATPQYALEHLLAANGLDPETDLTVEYLSEATQVAAMLQQTDDAVAVLPQPFVTTAMQQNDKLRVALSFADEWSALGDGSELVTGVLAVNAEFAKNNPQLLKQFLADYAASAAFTETNPEQTAALIAYYGILPKAAVALKALPHCGITLITGSEMTDALSGYLQTLYDRDADAVGGALPKDDFYHEG
ncbi:MAG: ABC transporter substrate-binding protein [Oscillospiraceae bacterium]|nr:ABC transporter substrate-binding protein [Oscillospiraceae bacterium]